MKSPANKPIRRFARRRILKAGTGAALGITAASCARRDEIATRHGAPRPNLLFICLDDVGCVGFDFYPDEKSRSLESASLSTPNLSRYAKKSWVRTFDCMRATPICWSTRMEALSGRKLWELGGQMDPLSRANPFPPGKAPEDYLFRYLPGYRTGAFGKWHLSLEPGDLEHPKRCGVDEYGLTLNVDTESPRSRYWGANWTTHESPGTISRLANDRFVDDEAVDAGIDFMRRHTAGGENWYCQIWFNLTHQPMVDLPGRNGVKHANPVDQFKEMMEYLDSLIGRIFSFLEQENLVEKTFVVIASDNGGSKVSGGEKGDLSERGIRIPFMIGQPGIVSGGREPRAAQITDLFPTFTALAGNPQERKFSKSLAKLFSDGGDDLHEYVGMTVYKGSWMVANNRWKLKTPPQARTRPEAGERLKLYDLRADPEEIAAINRNVLSGEEKVQVNRTLKSMKEFAVSAGLMDPREAKQSDPDTAPR